MEAINNAGSTVGVLGKQCVILAGEKKTIRYCYLHPADEMCLSLVNSSSLVKRVRRSIL